MFVPLPIRITEGWDTWPACSTFSHTPCSRPCSSWVQAALSMPFTPTRCRLWEDYRKYMPITHITFLIACLAIAGIPPFSGFFSKDEILAACFQYSPHDGWVMTVIAAMTAFYMFRLYYGIFWGGTGTRGKSRQADGTSHVHTPHESPLTMTVPLTSWPPSLAWPVSFLSDISSAPTVNRIPSILRHQ